MLIIPRFTKPYLQMTKAPLTPSANALMKLTVGCAKVFAFGNKDEVLKVNAYLDSRGQTTKNIGVILETLESV